MQIPCRVPMGLHYIQHLHSTKGTGPSDVVRRHMDEDFKMAAVSSLTDETNIDENKVEETVENSLER